MRTAPALALLLFAVAEPLIAQGGTVNLTGRTPGGFAGRAVRGPIPNGIPQTLFHHDLEGRQKPAHKGPIPLPPADRQWLRLESPHFVILSALGERSTRVIATDLERLTAYLTRTSTYFRVPAHRTRVFLFKERMVAQPYFDAVGAARVDATGLTLRHPRGSTMLVDAGSRGGGALTPRHELMHELLRREDHALPLWLDEGLAEYYSNLGQPIREHASRVRVRVPIPVQTLFVTRHDARQAWTYDFYAESWATVAVLMRRDPRAFFEFVEAVDRGADQVAALRQHFHMAPRDLEMAIRKSGAPTVQLPLDELAVTFEIMPMHYADLLYELGQMLSQVAGRIDDAERHLRAAIEQSPGNPAVLLSYAEVLLSKPGCATEARELAQRAIDHDGDSARALGLIALSYLAEGNKVAARDQLEPAIEAAPDREDLSYALFSLYVDAGERDRAEELFPRLVTTLRANDARRLLLKSDIARADTLARAGKVLEAAKILRELAPKMPAKTRANLELQAAGLEAASAQR